MKQDEASQTSNSKQDGARIDPGESGTSAANGAPYKVFIVAPTCFYYQTELFRALAAHPGIDLTVYFCSHEGISGQDVETQFKTPGKWSDEAELLEGYRYKILRNFSPRGSYLKWPFGLMNFGIWREIKRERPDAVLLMGWSNVTWWVAILACLMFRAPFLYITDVNIQKELHRPLWIRWVKRLLLGRVVFRLASGFLYAGSANKQLYRYYGVPEAKLIPFAYSWGYEPFAKAYRELASRRDQLRAELGIPQSSFVVLFCGRLIPLKNPVQLLEAYSKIDVPNKALIFVGDGTLSAALKRWVAKRKLPSVFFPGFQNRLEVPKYYAISDVLVLPSSRETWGIVVNEAMCFGLPVVVSDQVGASADLVRHGYNGYIFPSGDVQGLARSISSLASLPPAARAEMGVRSINLISEWYQRDLAGDLVRYLTPATPASNSPQVWSNRPAGPLTVADVSSKGTDTKAEGSQGQGTAPAEAELGRLPTGVKPEYKLCIIAPTCFYYQVDLFRELAAHARIALKVYFCSREGIDGRDVLRKFRTKNLWGSENDLLHGYKYEFLRNYSLRPSHFKWPYGLINLGIWNELKRQRPDAVVLMAWTNPTWFLAILACRWFKIPFFYMTDTNVRDDIRTPLWRRWSKRLILGKGVFPLTSGFLSNGTANQLLYASYGVPQEKFVPFAFSWHYKPLLRVSDGLRPQRNAIRARLGIGDDTFLILFVGRLSPEKAPMTLLAAYHRLKGPNKALFFVGDGLMRGPLQRRVSSHQIASVRFCGFQDRMEINDYYSAADVLVLPSLKEPAGMVVYEAMCFGLPVIVSEQVGYGADLVRDGYNGFRFPVGDEQHLARNLQTLLDMPRGERHDMGSRSRLLIEEWLQRDLPSNLLSYLDKIDADGTITSP